MQSPFEKIKKTTIGIAGCGGLGTHASISLARIGAKKLILADYDVVESSNLSRQFYFKRDIGKKKVKALKEVLNNINPRMSVEIHSVKLDKKNIQLIFRKVDVLIEALDKPSEKSQLINVFKKYFPNKPLICASGLAGWKSPNNIKTKKLGKNLWIVGDYESEAVDPLPLLCSRVAIVANHQVHQALRIAIAKKGGRYGTDL